MLPILHFTYADPHGDLVNLKRERKSIYNLMINRFLNRDYGFFQNNDFNQDDLDFGFRDFLSNITIFHFSGHAGMGEIRLQDGSTFIEGIAKQMKRALSERPLPQLVLVFLNGCSTGSLVEALLDAGVPIVIGTSAPVEDAKAADFSINFYHALLKGYTIKDSFKIAEEFLQTRDNKIQIFRGLRKPEGQDGNKPLWGLFNADNKSSLLDWKLPKTSGTSFQNESNYQVNSIIQGALYHSLLKAKLKRIVDLEERRLEGDDIREDINSSILLGYPGPISYKIAKLLNIELDNADKEVTDLYPIHLTNLYNVYQSLSELMFLIMLSQLWEICLGGNNPDNLEDIEPRLPVDYRRISTYLEIIKDFFTTKRKDRLYFDYIPKIQAIRKIFDEAKKRYFLNELEQLKEDMEKDEDLISCYQFFNNLRLDLSNRNYLSFDVATWRALCEKGEKSLAYFFEKISFCTRYDFAILKNIELCLPRFRKNPTYTYRLLKVPKNGNTKYFSFSPIMSGFTSVKSIVMLKTESFGDNAGVQILAGQINLSPFMLDYNVTDARAEKGDLLIYSHYEKESGNYMFEEAFKSDAEKYILTNEVIYEEVHETINAFVDVLFYEDIHSLNQ